MAGAPGTAQSGERGCVAMKRLALGIFLACSLCACARDKAASADAVPQKSLSAAAKETPAAPGVESKRAAKPVIDGARTMQYVKDVVAFGPRFLGSPGHQKLENYLRAHLKGDVLEEDSFTVESPEGKFPGKNFIAKFPGTKDGVIVIAGHYDTNYPLRNTKYVGANDGGSSTAILLELANHLRSAEKGGKRDGYSVWLVWTDAEEAMRQWSETDSLYGARHLAEAWEKDGTLKKVKAFLLADMIGDADLNVDRDVNSAVWLEDFVLEAATRLGVQSHFFAREIGVEDDHMPFVKRGVPCADLIDLDYGYNNVFHHSPQDTVDKLSPRSLEIVGDVIYETVRLVDERK